VNDPGFIQLGHCVQCGAGTNTFVNCVNEDTCRQQVLLCDDCAAHTATANCGREDCQQVAAELAAVEAGDEAGTETDWSSARSRAPAGFAAARTCSVEP